MITLAYLNFWEDPNNDDYFTIFIEKNIGKVRLVNYNENPDILISSVNGDIYKIKNINAKCKLFFYGENLHKYPPYNNDALLYEIFDLIVGFKETNLNKKQIRFPLWLIYYKYYNYDKTDNILTYIQNKYSENINKTKKTMFCSIIARHDTGGQRSLICNKLSKYGKIWAPSYFLKNTNSIGNKLEDKINFISKGIYTVCPENSCYEKYFTEKIFHAFEGGTIPLYWGVNYPEEEIINENKYCFCDIQNVDNLEQQIKDLIQNPEKYLLGNIFKDDAGIYINNFYTSLTDQIIACLTNSKD
jgi:hypothetical protein